MLKWILLGMFLALMFGFTFPELLFQMDEDSSPDTVLLILPVLLMVRRKLYVF